MQDVRQRLGIDRDRLGLPGFAAVDDRRNLAVATQASGVVPAA
jgi:hypothetical protein